MLTDLNISTLQLPDSGLHSCSLSRYQVSGGKWVEEEPLKEWWGLIHLILTVKKTQVERATLRVTLIFYSKYFHCIKILSVFLESHQSHRQVTVQLILFLTWTWQGFLSPPPGQCGLVFVLSRYRTRGQSMLQLICCYTTTTTLQTRALFHKVNWHYFKSDTWVIAWSLHIVCLIFLWKPDCPEKDFWHLHALILAFLQFFAETNTSPWETHIEVNKLKTCQYI